MTKEELTKRLERIHQIGTDESMSIAARSELLVKDSHPAEFALIMHYLSSWFIDPPGSISSNS